ncbi:unnamed protein product [Vitrella brassicaformis CCMP3155]|uniref:Uncharacterized protein n=1 Tax=Vitrella brassicaformis (strain CCMP3155) TaxID=1169540 RepID=A0A0G4EM59_VITBC|nr:unnamed protein product [Vitrella brassicaformis CCMP3155]|eukprot:CEL97943.1 unnamed protein product [Vitrella brassicaformis CCMP3155]
MLIPALQLFALLDACLPPPTREDETPTPHRETGGLPHVAILSTRLGNGIVLAAGAHLPQPAKLFLEVFLRTLLRGDTATSTSPPPRRLGTAEPPTLERRHSQRRRSETLQPPTFALVKPAQCLTINVSSEHLHLILQLPSTPQMDSAHTTRGIARQLSSAVGCHVKFAAWVLVETRGAKACRTHCTLPEGVPAMGTAGPLIFNPISASTSTSPPTPSAHPRPHPSTHRQTGPGRGRPLCVYGAHSVSCMSFARLPEGVGVMTYE